MHSNCTGQLGIVNRDDLAGISSVVVAGVTHELGLVKDFHGHPVLGEFVPQLARLSMSWVRLAAGEELASHDHPTKSMIIVTEGSGETLGSDERPIRTGDVVVVPPNTQHGFVGTGPDGFWALSVQFEGGGLYEDTAAPRVEFAGDRGRWLDAVRAENDRHLAAFGSDRLVTLVRDPGATGAVHDRLLDYLQTWSDGFQRIIAARVAAETDTEARLLAEEHLADEVGHNHRLAESRHGRPALPDPGIAAVTAWFVDRMATAGSVERTVLSHLVLEGSGMVFHQAGKASFPDSGYFALHADGDEEHMEMGYRLLASRQDWTVEQLSAVLRSGWQMMAMLDHRLAALAAGS